MTTQTYLEDNRPAGQVAPWWATAVTYQVYVRSFADADGDGVGDLDGLRRRLPHIASLGADAIWLNPCYPSPQRDHGYDVADYFDIEPAYGNLATFDLLVQDAAELGLRVLMDVVPNHCSDQHAWFREALASAPGSDARARFWFRDGRGGDGELPPNDWAAIFGGSAWTRVTEADGRPGQWYLGVFTPHQPDFNWDHADVGEHFDQMLRFWFDRGVAGFRADAVTVVGKAEGLPDVGGTTPYGKANEHFEHQPSGFPTWRRWRHVVDAYNDQHPGRDVFLIAEAWTSGRPDILAEYVSDEAFHQAFCFDLTMAAWNPASWRAAIDDGMQIMRDRPASSAGHPAWVLANHDVERTVTRYGRVDAVHDDHADGHLLRDTAPVDTELGLQRARVAILGLLGLPGSVFLYQGEELGLPEVLDLDPSVRQDPLFTQTGGSIPGRDGCRIPLPWTDDPATSFGFSDRPRMAWLPQPDDWGRHGVEGQSEDPFSILNLYRDALAARRQLPDLAAAPLEWLEAPSGVLAYSRGGIGIAMNFTAAAAPLPTALAGDGQQVLVSSSRGIATGSPTAPQTLIPPNAAVWIGAG